MASNSTEMTKPYFMDEEKDCINSGKSDNSFGQRYN